MFVCFFKQKTAYEMRISDWSSDVCSSDLVYPYGEISLALRQAVIDAGFAGAFGQHSGAAGGSADRFALPRFPLNEAYGALDRFRLLANALPHALLDPGDRGDARGDVEVLVDPRGLPAGHPERRRALGDLFETHRGRASCRRNVCPDGIHSGA